MKDPASALTVYIGHDPREAKAYDVAKASLVKRSSKPLVVQALKLHQLRKIGVMTRPVEMKDGRMWCPISQAPMATEFAISRFCVPFIHPKNRPQWTLFVDCDVLFLSDVAELLALADPKYAVMVVKHEHAPQISLGDKLESKTSDRRSVIEQSFAVQPDIKMDGQIQTFYARKNWSSVVLWNTAHESHLRLAGILKEGQNEYLMKLPTDEYGRFIGKFDWTSTPLNTWPGRDLHAFKWLADDEIGELPAGWNYLVGVTALKPDVVKLAHFTLGTPNIAGYEKCDFADEWRKEIPL